MNNEYLPTALIAIVVLVILLIGSSVFVTNYAIETIKQRANNLSISCSDIPTLNASEIHLYDTTFYCQLTET